MNVIENYGDDPLLRKYMADPDLTRIAFQNLVSNAVKYTPDEGTVTIDVKREGDMIALTVADTGYGIPQHQQDKIFSKLFRADNVRSKITEGTGLGLYIIKSIVEEVGGTVSFKSTEGKGTTFFIKLPASGMSSRGGNKALEGSVNNY